MKNHIFSLFSLSFLCCPLNFLQASPSPVLVDLYSTMNFAGSSSAQDVLLSITNSSTVNFQDTSTAANASISVDNSSSLNFYLKALAAFAD